MGDGVCMSQEKYGYMISPCVVFTDHITPYLIPLHPNPDVTSPHEVMCPDTLTFN